MTIKKRFFANHAKSSAALISLSVHAVLILIAISFVAVTVIQKEEKSFEAKVVKRPRQKLKKLQVPVKIKKKPPAPKLRKRMVAKPDRKFSEIKMPELVGIKGGVGNMGGNDLGSLGFNLDIDLGDLFGSNQSYGNELMGILYDLKLTDNQEPREMSNKLYFETLSSFTRSWNKNVLEDFYSAPRKKFSTVFYMPTMNASAAPKAFAVEAIVKPSYWVVLYRGEIAAPSDGRYRFWGYGDDVLLVRVKRWVVLQANWNDRKVTNWKSDDERNRQFKIFSKRHGETLFVGDWISLKKGDKVPIDILLGECGGGSFASALMIEQKGGEYETAEDGRPILPIFKTKDIPAELAAQMKVNPDEAALEGPSFGVLKSTF